MKNNLNTLLMAAVLTTGCAGTNTHDYVAKQANLSGIGDNFASSVKVDTYDHRAPYGDTFHFHGWLSKDKKSAGMQAIFKMQQRSDFNPAIGMTFVGKGGKPHDITDKDIDFKAQWLSGAVMYYSFTAFNLTGDDLSQMLAGGQDEIPYRLHMRNGQTFDWVIKKEEIVNFIDGMRDAGTQLDI